jgi:serine/threonine protein kinase
VRPFCRYCPCSLKNPDIVHGDIKPENVLVFKENPGRFTARVIDFGYSTRYTNSNQQLALPRSESWNAPENDGLRREWTLHQARKADLFCVGRLCLWLLFEACFSDTEPPRQTSPVTDIGREEKGTMEEAKGDLRTYARQLLRSNNVFEYDKATVLKDFFDSSLSKDPEEREMSLERLLSNLDPQW